MNISEYGIGFIKNFEGCRLESYQDGGGVYTIGYGHTRNVSKGMKINQSQADEFLKEDINRIAEASVNKYQDIYGFNQSEYDALCSFAFNIGSITQLTNKGERTREEIVKAMPLYCKMAGREVNGLKVRREAEVQLFLSNDNVNKENNKNLDSKRWRILNKMDTLKLGSKGAQVVVLQKLLEGVSCDGVFGLKTASSVKRFQRDSGLVEDGICGMKTWEKLLAVE